jgi:hypothetical protein
MTYFPDAHPCGNLLHAPRAHSVSEGKIIPRTNTTRHKIGFYQRNKPVPQVRPAPKPHISSVSPR